MPIRLTLTGMTHGGEALGRHQGKVVFVPYGLPGEDFDPCGGCQLQHASYSAQLRFKEEILRDQLRRIGGILDPPLRPCIGMPEPWRYRNHVQLHVSASGGQGRLGYLGARSHQVVPIQQCPIAHPALEDTFRSLELDFTGLRRLSLP